MPTVVALGLVPPDVIDSSPSPTSEIDRVRRFKESGQKATLAALLQPKPIALKVNLRLRIQPPIQSAIAKIASSTTSIVRARLVQPQVATTRIKNHS